MCRLVSLVDFVDDNHPTYYIIADYFIIKIESHQVAAT
jgi:hypothetical protein